jgi:type IV pilus assembly protein PilM
MGFLNKKQVALGLCVSESSIKLAQLEKGKNKFSIKAYSSAPVPKGLIIGDQISDIKTFNYLLRKAMEKPQMGRFSTNYAVLSLPESKSFVRVIQIPLMSEAEAENAVPYEAENFIPMPIDQVYLDWQKLDETGDKMNILIIASPKDFVDKYLSAIDQAKIITASLEVESQSCLRALIPKGFKETALIVNMNASKSNLIMVEKGNLQFTSTIPIAGNTFTESIATSLGISSAKAEEIKKKVGISNTPDYPNVKTALLPVLNNLSAEIKNILKFYGEHSQEPVSRIILAGGSAKLKNFAEFLKPQMAEYGNMAVELGNPLINLSPDPKIQINGVEILGFTIAIGLALRGVNL